jgi:hypothetical protein
VQTVIITCTTIDATVAVQAALIDAQLWPRSTFYIAVSVPFGPPITFTVLVELPADVLRQLSAIPDTTVT